MFFLFRRYPLNVTFDQFLQSFGYPHCQYCLHRDRAYELKFFSVLFKIFFSFAIEDVMKSTLEHRFYELDYHHFKANGFSIPDVPY